MLSFVASPKERLSSSSTVDDALIQSIAAGDHAAFHRLYELAAGSIYGFALSITQNTQDAEDVLQDTLLAVYTKAGSYDPQKKPMAFVLTIAKNYAISRRRKRETAVLDELPLVDEAAMSRVAQIEDRALITALLEHLDGEERQIVMLHAVAGLKFREIADLLSHPLGSTLSRYHRAIQKLRSAAKEGRFYET